MVHFGRVVFRVSITGVICTALASGAVACSQSGEGHRATASGSGGAGGSGGGSGGCLATPHPNVLVAIQTADRGPLPDDTTILANWSGGEAGPWVLGDPKTWRTLDASNLVCDVDRAHPPSSLKELHCEAWTTGPTRIRVNAVGFPPFDHTLAPSVAPCAPPGRIMVELEKPDGG